MNDLKTDRTTATAAWMNSLSEAASDYEKLVGQIAEKFSPVVRSEGAGATDAEKQAPDETLPKHCDTLRNIARHIQRHNDALRSILSRAEI